MPYGYRIVEVTRPFFPPELQARIALARLARHHLTLLALPVLAFPVVTIAQPAEQPVEQPAALQASDIDWVDVEALSPEQRTVMDDTCCGMYVEPPLPAFTAEPGFTILDGNLGAFSADGIAELEGNLQVIREDGVINADRGSYNRNTAVIELQDNIRIRQPGMLLTGSAATVDQTAGVSELQNASYLLHDAGVRGTANVIVYTDAAGIVTIDNGVYTRCEPGNDSWVVAGDNIVLNQQTGRGTARNVTLRVKDVPVFYVPWISFPINDDRATGFLAPVIGSTRDGGLDFAAPYYVNLAPNYDATITPRLQIERGVMLGLEFRHLGQRSQQILDMQYLPDDKLYNPATRNLPGTDSPPVADRWLLNYDFYAALARGWSAGIDYAAVSDIDYFQDLGNNGLTNTTQSYLYRDARIQYQGAVWNLRAAAQAFQIIDPSVTPLSLPYRSLPRINLEGTYYLDSGLEYGLDSEYVMFDRDINPARVSAEDIAKGALVTGSRLSLTPRISLPLTTASAFVTPTVQYKFARWTLDDQAQDQTDTPSRGIFTGSLDSGLIFERDTTLFGSDFLQTLEPRLFYLYSEYEDQSDIPVFDSSELTFSYNQLFRDDRFSGRDRVGDANQLTLALSSRLYDSRGREKARLSVGQIQYFEDRRVTLPNQPSPLYRQSDSALVGEFSYQLNDNWRASSYLEWSTADNELQVGNFQFQYQSAINHILNIAFRYRDDTVTPVNITGFDRTINQTDISAVWPLNDKWGLIGRWNYDHANKRNLETIAGLEYSNCCWNVRLIAREWIDNDALYFGNVEDSNRGIFIQFELKGLGSVLGGNVSGILNNGISGYREREYVR